MFLDRTRRLSSLTGAWLAGVILIGIAVLILFSGSIAWADTPDGLFHFQRTRALTEALQAGVFYPRLFPDFAFGYGHPIFNYYAPLSYYPAALLHWSGLGLEDAVLAGLALFLAAMALAMYHFLRCWTDPWVAFAGALLYMLWPYRMYSLFIRGALPESTASIWLPLIGLGMVKLYQQAEASNSVRGSIQPKYLVITVLAWCGLVLAHNLSALLALLAFGLLLPVLFVQSGRGEGGDDASAPAHGHRSSSTLTSSGYTFDPRTGIRRVLVVSIPLMLGAGLASFYALPALLELNWVSLGQFQNQSGYGNHFADLPTLADWSFPYLYPQASAATVPVPAYVLVVMSLLVLLCVDGHARRLRAAAIACLILLTCSLFLITGVSRPVWEAMALVLSKLVFPWRWQAILGFSTAWGTALTLQWVRDRFFQRLAIWYAMLLGVLLTGLVVHSVAGLPRSASALDDDALTREAMWEFDAATGQAGTTWLGEFMPIWVDEQRWAISRAPTDVETANLPPMGYGSVSGSEEGDAGIEEEAARITLVRDEYSYDRFSTRLARPMRLVFHTFFLPAWQVQIDGQTAQTFAVSNLGLLAVDVPEGEHELTLRWSITPAVAAGWIGSGLAWALALALLMVLGSGRKLVGGWIVLGLLVISIWVWPQREILPTAVGADFGEVRLETAYAAPARAGTTAEVELTWLLVSPERPLTSFVHLIGPDGAVRTQHDGPLAGVYTPFERWLPGMLVKRSHMVPIPADLAPGMYELMAGAYLSADPSAVLTPFSVGGQPSDGASHRVRIGTIEVLP